MMKRTRTSSVRTCHTAGRTDLARLSDADLSDILDSLSDSDTAPAVAVDVTTRVTTLTADAPAHKSLWNDSLHSDQDQQTDPFSTNSNPFSTNSDPSTTNSSPSGTKMEEESPDASKSKKDKLRTWQAKGIPWQWVKDKFLNPCAATLEEHSINKVCMATYGKEVHICVTFGGNPCREAKVFGTLLKDNAPKELLSAFTPLKGGAGVALHKEWSFLYGATNVKMMDITHRGIKRTKGTCTVKQLQEELTMVKEENAQLKEENAQLKKMHNSL